MMSLLAWLIYHQPAAHNVWVWSAMEDQLQSFVGF